MKVENGPRKPKRPRPKRPQWKKKQDQNGPSQHPKRPILMSKTAHCVTLYKYWINDVIKCTWGIPYKRVDAAAVVAAYNINVRRSWEPTPLFAVEALLSRHERTPTTLLQSFQPVYWNCVYIGINYMCLRARPNCLELWTSTVYIIVTAKCNYYRHW